MVMKRGATLQEQEDGVIYARYSSHSQKDASIEQQIKECLAYAKSQGIRIVATYSDRAITGKTDRRADFQRMMRDARKGEVPLCNRLEVKPHGPQYASGP